MALLWFSFFAALAIVSSRSHHHHKEHSNHHESPEPEKAEDKPVLYFDKPQDSVSKNLRDFFKNFAAMTTQPACPKYELCYGPSKSNVLFAVCYDDTTKIPIYSAEYMGGIYTGSRPPTTFKKDDNGPAQASSDDYDRDVQLHNHPTWSSGKFYLARGHLTASADMNDEQEYTFVMTNIAPQWQAFNNGNWRALETALRATGRKYLVVTGTADPIPGMDIGYTKPVVAVPRYFWKAVCDIGQKESVVFVAENPVGIITPNMKTGCSKSQTETRGIIQCGSVNDARKNFPSWQIPDFKGCGPTKMGLASLISDLQLKLK